MGAVMVRGEAPGLSDVRGVLSATDRLERAYEAALGRLIVKEREGTDPDIFNELGEALFWLRALVEANRRSAPVLDGLRWARNRIAHGLRLTAPTAWTYGSELGRMVLGQSMLGTASESRWLARSEIAAGTPPWSDAKGEAAYDAHIAGQSVLPTLRDGLALAR
jgi:hypothetical protein